MKRLHEPAVRTIDLYTDQADMADVAKSIRYEQTLFGTLPFVKSPGRTHYWQGARYSALSDTNNL
jgi:hypothetical protein